MQAVVLGNPLDGCDLMAFRLHGKHQAGIGRLAVEQNRATSANANLATLLRSREADGVAQDVL